MQSVKFDLPDAALRKHAITRLIPPKAPIDRSILTEELLDKLATITEGFSYREIKNAVLLTLTECCVRDCGITAQLLEEVFAKKKKEVDDLKSTGDARKKELGRQVAENLKTGNYAVVGGQGADQNGRPMSHGANGKRSRHRRGQYKWTKVHK